MIPVEAVPTDVVLAFLSVVLMLVGAGMVAWGVGLIDIPELVR